MEAAQVSGRERTSSVSSRKEVAFLFQVGRIKLVGLQPKSRGPLQAGRGRLRESSRRQGVESTHEHSGHETARAQKGRTHRGQAARTDNQHCRSRVMTAAAIPPTPKCPCPCRSRVLQQRRACASSGRGVPPAIPRAYSTAIQCELIAEAAAGSDGGGTARASSAAPPPPLNLLFLYFSLASPCEQGSWQHGPEVYPNRLVSGRADQQPSSQQPSSRSSHHRVNAELLIIRQVRMLRCGNTCRVEWREWAARDGRLAMAWG